MEFAKNRKIGKPNNFIKNLWYRLNDSNKNVDISQRYNYKLVKEIILNTKM